MEQPNYYAVIPSNVRYDKELKANEKLLYGEIAALTQKDGTCWATNKYFAELYDTTNETISRYLSHLKEKGYITMAFQYSKENEKLIEKRIIGIDKNINIPCQKNQEGIDENVKENNTSNNNNIPPIPPKRGNARKAKQDDSVLEILNAYECSDELRQALLDFMEERKKKRKPVSDRALKLLLKNLDTLSSQEKEKTEIVEQSIMNGWLGFFPLRKNGVSTSQTDLLDEVLKEMEQNE